MNEHNKTQSAGLYRIMKRIMDVSISLVALCLLAPLMVLVWVLVRQQIGSPALFRQARPGLNGAPFKLIKFRTMTDARDKAGELLPDAVRMTRLGKMLRSSSLDELPELWNVLKGEMSLVGPRPLLMEYLPLYSREQARRHDVRPGLTGWAQVNGRNALSWEEKFMHDVWYVQHIGLGVDLKIIGLTLLRVFSRTGISQTGHATAEKFGGNSQ